MKNKKAILKTTTLRVIITVMVLAIVLIPLMVKLVGIQSAKTERQIAEGNLENIISKINFLVENPEIDQTDYLITGPKNWFLLFFENPILSYSVSCDGSCLCICKEDSLEGCNGGVCENQDSLLILPEGVLGCDTDFNCLSLSKVPVLVSITNDLETEGLFTIRGDSGEPVVNLPGRVDVDMDVLDLRFNEILDERVDLPGWGTESLRTAIFTMINADEDKIIPYRGAIEQVIREYAEQNNFPMLFCTVNDQTNGCASNGYDRTTANVYFALNLDGEVFQSSFVREIGPEDPGEFSEEDIVAAKIYFRMKEIENEE